MSFDLNDIIDAAQSGGATAGGSAAGMALGGPVGAAIGGQLGAFLGSLFGPGYDPANGGEVKRQIEGTDLGNDPHASAMYYAWLQKYQPYAWQTGDIWGGQSWDGAPSPWFAVYKAFRDAGLGTGAWMLDGGNTAYPDPSLLGYKAIMPDGSGLTLQQVKDAVNLLQSNANAATGASKANAANGTATPGEYAVLDSGAAQTASIIPADAGKWLLYALAAFVLYKVATK